MVYLQIAWWKRAALVMDPPAAGFPSRWKPVASASLDTAPLYKRPNRATAPPTPSGRELLPLTPAYAAREALGPFPALTTATSKSYVLLPKRRRPWPDRRERSCTGSDRRHAPSAPKTQKLLHPLFPVTAAASATTSGPGTVFAPGLWLQTALFSSTWEMKFSLFLCAPSGRSRFPLSSVFTLRLDLCRLLRASQSGGAMSHRGFSPRFHHQRHFVSAKGVDAEPGSACGVPMESTPFPA